MNKIPLKDNILELNDQIRLLTSAKNKLSAELKSVNQKLKDSEALKGNFVSNVRNEIINPFTSIIGLSKTIIQANKEDWKRVITMVAMIHSEAFNLDLQLRNIFMVAKIESGDISPEINHVDVAQLVAEVIEAFNFAAKKKNVEVNHQNLLPAIKGNLFCFQTDAEKLRLILSNLLSNAIKYSYESGTVTIVSEVDSEALVLSVKDNGTGISEANKKIIFDRFMRLDSGINSINRGHGIGLSVNKALLDILDGKIIVRSMKNQGSEFIISIPECILEGSDMAIGGDEFIFQDPKEGESF